MKKITTLWSILLIALTIVSCQKAEIATPNTDISAQMKKSGSGGTTTTVSTTYSGQSTGLNATIWNTQNYVVTSTQTILAQTKFLPTTGGAEYAAQAQAAITGVLTADSLYASTQGGSGTTVSTSWVKNVDISVGGHTITADFMQATAKSQCGNIRSGNSQFNTLVIDGNTITVTGVANQAIYFANGGMIILNEQSTSKKATSTMTVTAMHIILPNVADISLASTRADVKCN